MPTAYLNPDGIQAANNWGTGGTTASELSQGNTSAAWVSNNGQTAKTTLTLSNFTDSFSAINSINYTIVSFYGDARGGFITANVRIMNASTTLYSENSSVTVNGGNFATYNGTSRTTSDGSSAWTNSDLDDLRLTLTFQLPVPAGRSYLQQAYINVDYTAPSGYTHDISGLAAANISKVNTVATANIGKINSLD